MATGAIAGSNYSRVTYKYTAAGATKPTAPADIAAFNAAFTAAEEVKVRGDLDVPLDQSGEQPSNITWRESNENGEQYVLDITPAPGQATTLEMVLSGHFNDDVMQTITNSALNTWATLYIDIQSVAGTPANSARTAGSGTSSPQGTAVAVIMRHGKPSMNLRTTDVQHATLSASWDSSTLYHYGPA